MQIGSIIAVYLVVWWLTFVAIVPIGTHSHHETGTEIAAGSDPASPVMPRLGMKILLATVLSAIFTALLLWGLTNETLHHYWNR